MISATRMMETTTNVGGSNKYYPVMVTAAACTLATFWYSYYYNNGVLKSSNVDDDVKAVELLPIEQTLASGGGGDNAMSTLTWVKVPTKDTDQIKMDAIIEYLKRRTQDILDKNSWLAGRVQKHQGGKYALLYNPNKYDIDDYFHITSDLIKSRQELSLGELGVRLADHLLKVGPSEPLWKVNIIIPSSETANADTSSNGDDYAYLAVVVSMSHVIGDGETFYKIQNMILNSNEPIESLIAERITTTESQQIEAMGGREEYSILSSAGFIMNCIGGVFQSVIQKSKYTASSRIFVVDPKAMDETKKQQCSTIDDGSPQKFVSSNDVLTSWFLQNCNCTNGYMAVNWRNKLPGHTAQHAGNYENVIFYRVEDSSSPMLIRQSISSSSSSSDNNNEKEKKKTFVYQRRVTNDRPMPTFREMLMSTNAICTNWSTFSKPCKFLVKGCVVEEDIQIPLYNVAALLPSTMALCLIFRLPDSQLGLFVAGSPDKLVGLETDLPPFLQPYKEE